MEDFGTWEGVCEMTRMTSLQCTQVLLAAVQPSSASDLPTASQGSLALR